MAVIAMLAACQSGGNVRGNAEGPPETKALELISAGRYVEAADEYLALARGTRGEDAQEFMLKAVAVLVDIGHTDRALALMDEIEKQPIAESLAARHDLLAANLSLLRGLPDRALEQLPVSAKPRFVGPFAATFHQLRARAMEDAGRHLDAARERNALADSLDDSIARAANDSALWDALGRVPPEALERAANASTGAMSGWIALSALARRHQGDPAALERAVAGWRATYPTHPANAEIIATMIGSARLSIRLPSRIALLLPLNGSFAKAAAAVRDGFLAAWYADSNNAKRPTVELHDTSVEDINVIYSRAVESGADFVVGPLERSTVTALVCSDAVAVPTLALNEPSSAPTEPEGDTEACSVGRKVDQLYHFGLTPESEARQVAELAWFDGRGKALSFTPEGDWGERVHEAFATEWERLGGVLLDHRSLPAESADLSKPIADALAVQRSRDRAKEVTRILGRKVEHQPRRRQDVDFVFMAAFPVGARQLKPQLEFQHAWGVPVYSTSHAYSGVPDATNDRDLDGIVIGDMPALIAPSDADRVLLEQLKFGLRQRTLAFPRLYAFGADAYRLAVELKRIALDSLASIDGHTGRLTIDANNRVTRRLAWARFVDGLPQPLTAEDATR